MATQVGEAVIKLTFDGKELSAKLENESSKLKSAGENSGRAFASAWTVAAGNLIADGIKKVGSIIGGAMDSAMSRVDTLQNFPKVMQSLGYSAEESASSIQLIGDKLDGLPTSLDGMASDVQKLAATMGNLNNGMVNATTVGLSLNNMFLAGGKGTEAASAAMEQYNQMLARGKVDQQSWNSMVNAAPGQMKQLAETLLGANKNQTDLYNAMQKGTVTFDQFNEALVKLNEEGGEGFESFTDQAIAATGGFQTQLQNIKTSLTKVVASALTGDYEAMIKGTQSLVKRITATLPQLVEGFSMAFQGIVSIVPQLLSELSPVAMEAVYHIADAVVAAIPVLLDAITEAIPDIVSTVAEIGVMIVDELPYIITSLIQALGALIPSLMSAITDIITEIVYVFTMPETINMILNAALQALMAIVRAIPTVVNKLSAALPEIINNIVSFLTDPGNLQSIIDGAIQLLMALVDAVPVVLNALVSALPQILNAITTFLTSPDGLQRIIQGAITLLMSIVNALPTILTALVSALPQVLQAILNFLLNPDNLNAIINGAIELLMGIIQSLPTILTALITALPQILESILRFLLDPGNLQKIIEGAIQLFFGIVKAVPQILGALLGAFGNLVGNLWNWITQKFGEFAANFGNFIGGIFKRAINGVLSFIENFINGPIDLINGAIDLINNIPGVDIGHVPRVYLPRLAQGGVTTGATTAIIGEAGQEVVLPLQHNQDNWAGVLSATLVKQMNEDESVSNRPIQVTMNNYIENEMDAEDIGRKLMTSIRRAA